MENNPVSPESSPSKMLASQHEQVFRGARAGPVFRFVISELLRLQTKVNEGPLADLEFPDVLFAINMPSGRRHMIGRNAEQKLYELAQNTVENHDDLNGKIDPKELVKEFKLEIAKWIENETDISPADIVKECAARLISIYNIPVEYFVLCVLPEHSLISRFRIGPVEFHRKDRIWNELEIQFSGQEKDWFDHYGEEAKYYNWIASVSISGFNKNRGRERAYLLTELAISAIKIVYPQRDAIWFGTDAQLRPQHLQHGISQTKEEKASIYWKKTYLGLKDDETVEWLLSSQRGDFIYLVGNFLGQYALRGGFGFIGNKIVSALKWADVASSHLLPSQRIISYSNCLEALFITDDKGVKAQICDRAACFLKVVDRDRDWKQEVAKFYKARSDLVHGRISPVDEKSSKMVASAKLIADNCVIGMMYFCDWLLKKYPTENAHRNNSPFSGRANLTKAFLNDLPIFIEEIGKSSR